MLLEKRMIVRFEIVLGENMPLRDPAGVVARGAQEK